MKNQIQNIKNIIEEVNLFYIHRGCFMIPKSNNFNNEKDNLIFLYSIHENGDKAIYKPIAVIDCLKNQDKYNAINSFVQISENNDVIKNPKILENNYNCTCYIIKYDNDDNSSKMKSSMNSQFNTINNVTLINSQTYKNNEETKIDFYLMLAIQLKKEKNSLKQIMGQQYVSNIQKQTEYYLINKNYTNELNKILYNINQIIEKYQGENEINLLQIIKSQLNNEIINKINKLSREKIQKQLDNRVSREKIQKQLDNREFNELKISYANNEEEKCVCFYQNFDIISKEMVDILKKIDINIDSKLIKVRCIFHNYKIIMLLNKNLINIYYYFNTDEITIQYIIMTEKTVKLFNMLLNQGYNFIEKYLPYNKVDIPIIYNNNLFENISIIIFKIIKGNKVEFRISDKLKTLLLMAYSQIKLYDNKSHEVYLINPQWLKQYQYNDILKFKI